MNISEIRINDQYVNLYTSEYKSDDIIYKDIKKNKSIPIIKHRTMQTDMFIMKYKNQLNLNYTMLPPNCRYIEHVKDGSIVIIEEPPNIRTITIDMSFKHELYDLKQRGILTKYGYENMKTDRMKYKLTLAFPYVIFIFYISNNIRQFGQVFLRTSPLFNLGDYLFKMPLFNISPEQNICFGNRESGEGSSLLSIIQKSIMSFWSTIFNNDYINNYESYSKIPIINNYLEWEYMTKTNPIFIYDVDWICFNQKDLNLRGYINNIKTLYDIEDHFNYNTLKSVFNKPIIIEEESTINKIYNKKNDLYYDIANSILLKVNNEPITIQVGDSITLNNGNIGYIESFIGRNNFHLKYILVNFYGKQVHMKATKKLKMFIAIKIIEQRFKQTALLKNGQIIKYNDIILINNKYKLIENIRKSIGSDKDDIMEIKIEGMYYLSNHINGEVLNKNNIIINDIQFKQNNNYIITSLLNNHEAKQYIDEYKFIDINVINNQSLQFEFNNINTNEYMHLNEYINKDTIINKKQLKPLSNIFRAGGYIIKYSKELVKNKLLYKNKNIYLTNITNDSELLLKDDIDYIIKNNKFHLEGIDYDITFNIGDKVITSNWVDPMDVLNIKTIKKFEYDEKTNNVYFILNNNNGDIIKHLYISENKINIGSIRKITNKFNELYIGMKIKAKETKISCFPKKDTNIIIAIIIDINTQPLVLCSNGCTLFYSDIINKFELIDVKSKRWNKLAIKPLNMTKIKYQPGDIVKYNKNTNHRYVIAVNYNNICLLPMDINYSINQNNFYHMNYINNDNIILDCIPNPRLTKNQINEKLIHAYYNFHGGKVELNTKSNFQFIQY